MKPTILPAALTTLIDEFGGLPGVGPRTAERYAYAVLRRDARRAEQLDQDESRNRRLICVVEEPLDIVALERTGQYSGTYHVLGGAISPIDGIGPEQLHIPELIERIKHDNAEELIIATNASVEGESTALFLQRYLQEASLAITISRLARGIPVGVDLEYADQITLTHALEGRRTL